MSVRVIPWKPERLTNRWFVDIRFRKPDGTKVRDRQIHEAPTLAQAKRWAEAREGQLRSGALVLRDEQTAAPTWDEFFPRFIADREGGGTTGKPCKRSSLRSMKQVNERAIKPTFGTTPLDKIDDQAVSVFRGKLAKTNKPKSVNNIMTVLNAALKLAHEWGELSEMPCRIKIRAIQDARPDFFDFDDYARLCEGAAKIGTREHVLVRLGGDAGLRRGEMIALRWGDVDIKRRQIRIEQAAWAESAKTVREEGLDDEWAIDKPKSGKGRVVPMTSALHGALQAHRHVRGTYVLCLDDGCPVPGHTLRDWLEAAQRRAGLVELGALHKLRHTFCSHLAMRGAPAKAIQELAGHESLSTTLRYMHLAPGSLDAAVALLEPTKPGATVGATLTR